MMKNRRKRTCGYAANAAAARALMSSEVNGKRYREYVEFIFNTLKISGSDSYERLLDLMHKNEVYINI